MDFHRFSPVYHKAWWWNIVNNSLFGLQNYEILIQFGYRQTTGSANGFEPMAYVFGSVPGIDTNLRSEMRADSSEWLSTVSHFKTLPSVFSNPLLMSVIILRSFWCFLFLSCLLRFQSRFTSIWKRVEPSLKWFKARKWVMTICYINIV